MRQFSLTFTGTNRVLQLLKCQTNCKMKSRPFVIDWIHLWVSKYLSLNYIMVPGLWLVAVRFCGTCEEALLMRIPASNQSFPVCSSRRWLLNEDKGSLKVWGRSILCHCMDKTGRSLWGFRINQLSCSHLLCHLYQEKKDPYITDTQFHTCCYIKLCLCLLSLQNSLVIWNFVKSAYNGGHLLSCKRIAAVKLKFLLYVKSSCYIVSNFCIRATVLRTTF